MSSAPKQLELFRTIPRPAPEPVRPVAVEPAPPRSVSPPPIDPADALAQRLAPRLHAGLADLTLTDNRRRILSGRPAADGRLALRVHRCFADAPDGVLSAMACFFDVQAPEPARRAALEVLRIHHGAEAPEPPPPKRPKTRPRGRFFDLEEIRDRINVEYFDGEVEVAISWGQASHSTWNGRLKRRLGRTVSRRFGVYLADLRLVRIHAALDRADVPLYVIESIVHHEMLHAVVPPIRRPGKRRLVHPPEFRRRERLFRDHDRAERWIAEEMRRLAGLRHI